LAKKKVHKGATGAPPPPWSEHYGWKGKPGGSGKNEPAWIRDIRTGVDDRPVLDHYRIWCIYQMMNERKIANSDIGAFLNLSKQRVQYLLVGKNNMEDSLNSGERLQQGHERLLDAITAITHMRHITSPGHEDCKDVSCGVYLAAGQPDTKARKMVQAKEEWIAEARREFEDERITDEEEGSWGRGIPFRPGNQGIL